MPLLNKTGQLCFVSNLPNTFASCVRKIISSWKSLILTFSVHPLSQISLSLGKQAYHLKSLLFRGYFKNPNREDEMGMNSEVLGNTVNFHPFSQQMKPDRWILHQALCWICSCLGCTGSQMQRLLAYQSFAVPVQLARLAELVAHCLVRTAPLQSAAVALSRSCSGRRLGETKAFP